MNGGLEMWLTVPWHLSQGYNPAYGARPLRRAIMRLLEDSMAEVNLSCECDGFGRCLNACPASSCAPTAPHVAVIDVFSLPCTSLHTITSVRPFSDFMSFLNLQRMLAGDITVLPASIPASC